MEEYIFPLITAWTLATINLCMLWFKGDIDIEYKYGVLTVDYNMACIPRVIASLVIYGISIYMLLQ